MKQNILEELVLQSLFCFKVIKVCSNWLNENPLVHLYRGSKKKKKRFLSITGPEGKGEEENVCENVS